MTNIIDFEASRALKSTDRLLNLERQARETCDADKAEVFILSVRKVHAQYVAPPYNIQLRMEGMTPEEIDSNTKAMQVMVNDATNRATWLFLNYTFVLLQMLSRKDG